MRTRYRYLIPAAISITLALAGCGGDGGGPSAQAPATTTSSGFPSKGIIKAGKVVAQELDAQGKALREVGNATTGADGFYQLTIGNGYAGGPVLFTTSATATTTMVCDVQPRCAKVNKNFGEDFTVLDADPNFQMTAIVSGATTGDRLTVQITPFTHMAAQRALARLPALPAGTTPAKAVDEVNSEVNNLLGGLDVLRSRPRNLANAVDMKEATATERAYALLTSAIGKLALGDTTGPGLTEAVRMLAESFKEGKIKADEGGAPDNIHYSLKEILDAAKAQRASLNLTDDSGVLADLEGDIANAGTGDIDPQPSPLAGDTRIAKAKGLVRDMRTWANQIQNLEGPAKAFANEVALADQATRSFQGPIGESLMNGVALTGIIGDANQSGGILPYGPGTSYDPNTLLGTSGSGQVVIGSCVSGKFTKKLQGTLGTENLNITFVDDCPPVGQSVSGGSSSLTGTVENNGLKLSIDTGSATVNYTAPLNPDTTTPEQQIAAFKDASLKLKATLAQKGVSEPVSFTGEGQFDVVRCGGCAANPMDPTATLNPSHIKLSGSFSKGAKSFSGTADATLSNATTFDRNKPEAGSNVATGTLTLTLSAKLDGLPEAQFTLTVNRTGYVSKTDLGTASLTIAHGGSTLRIDASKPAAIPAALSITFTNQDGAKLSVSGIAGGRTGDVKLDNAKMGTVEEMGSTGIFKVSYEDGTFETVN